MRLKDLEGTLVTYVQRDEIDGRLSDRERRFVNSVLLQHTEGVPLSARQLGHLFDIIRQKAGLEWQP